MTSIACTDDTKDPVDVGVDTGVTEDKDAGVVDTGPADTGSADAATDAGTIVDMGAADSSVDAGPVDMGDTSRSIVFLHTNDEHSHLFGFGPNVDDYPNRAPAGSGIKGSLYRRAAVMERLEQEAGRAPLFSPVAKVGAGDIMMGSLFHLGNLFASPDYNIATVLGYDVLTLGNHEFDFGPGLLAQMISQGNIDLTGASSPLQIPLVASNIRFSMDSTSDDALANLYGGGAGKPIQRTFVKDFGGVKVGFVGVLGLDAAVVAPFKSPVSFSLAVDPSTTCSSNAQCPGSICIPPANNPTATMGSCAVDSSGTDPAIHFPALVQDIASAVAELRAQNVDMVVAVSHSGIDEREVNTLQTMGMGLQNARRSEEILLALGVDQALSGMNIRGLDLIIGGHSHTALDVPLQVPNANSGINTYIVQAGANGAFVGKVRLLQQAPGMPWTLDATYSGLANVDDSVNFVSSFDTLFDLFINQLMDGLEQQGIAQAGDNLLFPGEQCDGSLLPNRGQCSGLLPNFDSGTLACHANRQLDFSGCNLVPTKTICGDNRVDGLEMCDGTSSPQTCQDLGYAGGTIACASNCTVDVSGCTPDFPSLLEIALNFQRSSSLPPIRYEDTNQRGSLFFYELGTTSFDVGETTPSNESNLANLVADANRWAANTYVPEFASDPVLVSVTANGVVRDGVYQGMTGKLTTADLFRVVPLGISPIENTPGFSVTDFYLSGPELKAALETGLTLGMTADSFWLSVSGARVTYDMSLPPFNPAQPETTGQITRIEIVQPSSHPYADTRAAYESQHLYDSMTGFSQPNRFIHVAADFYITLFLENLGFCPRDAAGNQLPECRSCTNDNQCTLQGSTCNTTSGRCVGGPPVAVRTRTRVPLTPGITQELKEFLALMSYVRETPKGLLPTNYNNPVPRRMCCVGSACPADNSRSCN